MHHSRAADVPHFCIEVLRTCQCMQMDSQAEPVQGFADLLHSYHSLYPLEDISARAERPSPVFGVPSAVLKGIGLQNGQAHAIRRFDARQVFMLALACTASMYCIPSCVHLCFVYLLYSIGFFCLDVSRLPWLLATGGHVPCAVASLQVRRLALSLCVTKLLRMQNALACWLGPVMHVTAA